MLEEQKYNYGRIGSSVDGEGQKRPQNTTIFQK